MNSSLSKTITYMTSCRNIDLYRSCYRPVSLENLEEAQKIALANKIPLIVNFSRIVENAMYFWNNVEVLSGLKIGDIIHKIAAATDVCVLDAAQDPRCNIGGLIATNAYKLYEKYMNEVVVYEGLHTYGGMDRRTIEIFARVKSTFNWRMWTFQFNPCVFCSKSPVDDRIFVISMMLPNLDFLLDRIDIINPSV